MVTNINLKQTIVLKRAQEQGILIYQLLWTSNFVKNWDFKNSSQTCFLKLSRKKLNWKIVASWIFSLRIKLKGNKNKWTGLAHTSLEIL